MANQLMDMKKAKILGAIVSLSFLSIHVVMILLFHHCGVWPMFYFNIFSILFYIGSFWVLHREKLFFYVVSVYLEVMLHMSLAVFFTGWNNGFQITMIGMNILLFFSEYLGRSMRYRHVPALPFSCFGMVCYTACYLVSYFHPAPYVLPEQVSFWLQIAWGIIVFVINILFLHIFVLLTFYSEAFLAKQAGQDKLTGLPNRHYIADYLHKLEDAEDLTKYWVAMADIDNFKRVNDTYGHNCGDFVLKTIAEIIRSTMKEAEVCRWGGEEFLMLGHLSSCTVPPEEQLDALRRNISEYTFYYDQQKLKLTITIGLAYHQPETTVTDWINLADKKLYAGKCTGKNKVVA